ncbi:hypothetical protein E0Z10_g6785 [Xylaria hypoxylon]|uniref:Uncharacterized protein n=1 Tax=Xylaria hypoxylon TaxID=37992 RepID=A0A4Z0YU31_9PEZI|nr:hypothetical protein E0Z10_g6785 [Xylaria hypoxylon]
MAPPVSGFKLNANGVPDFDALPLRAEIHDSPHAQAQGETFFQRDALHRQLIDKAPRIINDDVWTFNSQVSTQWDGLRHFAYQDAQKFYNGVEQGDIHHVDEHTGERSTVLGIQAWAEQGIVGRGVLVDYHGWRASPEGQTQSKVKEYDSFESVSIPLEDLQACLKAQGTELKFGDILFIRSGFMVSLATKTKDELATYRAVVPHHFGGVEQSEDMLRWIWDHFAAVAGDQPSFECWPTKESLLLHEVLLAGWGCPIGELFDLEKLAEHCREQNRWTFFKRLQEANGSGDISNTCPLIDTPRVVTYAFSPPFGSVMEVDPDKAVSPIRSHDERTRAIGSDPNDGAGRLR